MHMHKAAVGFLVKGSQYYWQAPQAGNKAQNLAMGVSAQSLLEISGEREAL